MIATFEIAFRIPGKGWRRKSFKHATQAEQYVERLPADAEIRWSF